MQKKIIETHLKTLFNKNTIQNGEYVEVIFTNGPDKTKFTNHRYYSGKISTIANNIIGVANSENRHFAISTNLKKPNNFRKRTNKNNLKEQCKHSVIVLDLEFSDLHNRKLQENEIDILTDCANSHLKRIDNNILKALCSVNITGGGIQYVINLAKPLNHEEYTVFIGQLKEKLRPMIEDGILDKSCLNPVSFQRLIGTNHASYNFETEIMVQLPNIPLETPDNLLSIARTKQAKRAIFTKKPLMNHKQTEKIKKHWDKQTTYTLQPHQNYDIEDFEGDENGTEWYNMVGKGLEIVKKNVTMSQVVDKYNVEELKYLNLDQYNSFQNPLRDDDHDSAAFYPESQSIYDFATEEKTDVIDIMTDIVNKDNECYDLAAGTKQLFQDFNLGEVRTVRVDNTVKNKVGKDVSADIDALIELKNWVESEYNITVPDEDLTKLARNPWRYISNRIKKQTGLVISARKLELLYQVWGEEAFLDLMESKGVDRGLIYLGIVFYRYQQGETVNDIIGQEKNLKMAA